MDTTKEQDNVAQELARNGRVVHVEPAEIDGWVYIDQYADGVELDEFGRPDRTDVARRILSWRNRWRTPSRKGRHGRTRVGTDGSPR